MSIQEASLASILGSDKYHSVIVTTYTIDPAFVKKIFVPLLQSNRVRNVTILCDRNELKKKLQDQGNLNLLSDTSFLVLPASTNLLFHPKVMLFVGEEQGMLVIGSGNLTHSGMGGNQEVWGAFHYSLDNPSYSNLFNKAWHFIQTYIPNISGIGKYKTLEWFIDYAPWLKEIVNQPQNDDEALLKVVSNESDLKIWSHLKNRIKGRDIVEAIVMSPFYDKKAQVINELRSLFPKVNIKLVYDEYGQPPIVNHQLENVLCYSWQKLNSDSDNGSVALKRLHAKLILLKDKNGNEILLFGSANASTAGMGINSDTSRFNIELSILAEGSKNKFSSKLGIDLKPEKGTYINEIQTIKTGIEEPSSSSSFDSLYIIYAEQNGNRISIDLNKVCTDDGLNLILYGKKGKALLEKEVKIRGESSFELLITKDAEIPKVCFIGIEKGSRKYIVYHPRSLNLDNPDPRSSDIQNVLVEISRDSFGSLAGLFDDLFRRITKESDKTKIESNKTSKSSTVVSDDEKDDSDVNYKKEDFEERKRGVKSQNSESFVFEGLFAIIKALDDQFKDAKEEETSDEVLASDSSQELETSSEEADQPEEETKQTFSETLSRIKGFRSYLKKVLKYYENTDKVLKEANEETIAKFISNWVLVCAVALHVIRTDLKEDPTRFEKGLDSKTTILPYYSDSKITIDDIAIKLVMSIVGRLSTKKLDVDIKEYLEEEKRVDASIKFILLLHLRHWKKERDFIKACKNTLKLFEIDNSALLKRFNEEFIEASQFYKSAKKNDWRYHRHFEVNLDSFNKVYK